MVMKRLTATALVTALFVSVAGIGSSMAQNAPTANNDDTWFNSSALRVVAVFLGGALLAFAVVEEDGADSD